MTCWWSLRAREASRVARELGGWWHCYLGEGSSPSCAVLSHSVMSDSVTPWTVARQAPLSVGIFQARILEWVALPSSRASSQPRDQTQVLHIAGRFFTIWATREASLWKKSLFSSSKGNCEKKDWCPPVPWLWSELQHPFSSVLYPFSLPLVSPQIPIFTGVWPQSVLAANRFLWLHSSPLSTGWNPVLFLFSFFFLMRACFLSLYFFRELCLLLFLIGG